MKKLLLFAFAAFALAACSDDIYYSTVQPSSYTVDFESAVLGDEGYLWGKPQSKVLTEDDADSQYFGEGSAYFFGPIYMQGNAAIHTLYTDYLGLYGSAYDTWNGFVISNHTDMKTLGPSNQMSVYAPSGADDSKQFAVAYYGAWTGDPFGTPAIHFTEAVEPQTIAVANTTYLYLYFQDDRAAIVDVKGVITGYNSGIKTGSVEVVLADAKSGKVQSGWENVDLSSLGMVTKLTFTVLTTDSMCPLYFAIDNLVYTK